MAKVCCARRNESRGWTAPVSYQLSISGRLVEFDQLVRTQVSEQVDDVGSFGESPRPIDELELVVVLPGHDRLKWEGICLLIDHVDRPAGGGSRIFVNRDDRVQCRVGSSGRAVLIDAQDPL